MRIWGKRTEKESRARGVARAALDGASREELLLEAQHSLANEGKSGRIGVWLESGPNSNANRETAAGFHGIVWDRGCADIPQDWAQLFVEPPLPEELLYRGITVEEDLESSPSNPIIGLLVGVRQALWVPIQRKEQLKGVILAGSLGKQAAISREHVESVAAELAMAMGLEEEQRDSRRRTADLGVVRRFLAKHVDDTCAEVQLARLVESCTQTPAVGDGPGATFAAIGALRPARGPSDQSVAVEFLWHSGAELWTRALESEPLASLWRRALQERRTIGSASDQSWTHSAVDRLVSFPLESEGEVVGVLVAGLPGRSASLAVFDRLELRASLAAAALLRRRRRAQESRCARQQQALLKHVSAPLLLLDEAGRIAAASRGAQDLTSPASETNGRPPATIPAQAHLGELFRRQDQKLIEAWLRAPLEVGKGVGGDVGGERLDVNNVTVRAELHNGVGVQLRRAEPAPGDPAVILLEPLSAADSSGSVKHSETELQNVIEWLEEGVVLFDFQDNVRAMNTRFEQIAGMTPEESGKFKTLDGLIARLENQAADPARFAERWRELARSIEGGVREELQMAYPAPRILERFARPVLDPLGRHLGRVEIYRDVTAMRTFQSKLLQTEKLAVLGRMVSSIAHELSNPLTSIVGYAHRLLERSDTAGRSEEARHIYQEAERGGAILRQLLLNARETLPERRRVSLNQIVHRAMDLQRSSLAADKIRVKIDLDPMLPFVEGDPGHLQQVLMNLVGNAQQALAEQGHGGTITLRTKRDGERRVLLEVADNGPGIPHSILARIFDPFFTTKPAGEGTGLGLAVVLSVVREHGGQVHVVSPPKGGVVFQIELPAAAEKMPGESIGSLLPERKNLLLETTQSSGHEKRLAPARDSGRGARVLVVEDEPTVARLIADVLEDEGMHVDVLLDGRKALQSAARKTFDLVICDMKMPGLDGQHFYRSLELSGNPLRERFLFVTGDIIAAQTREFLERNHLPHVAKPFRVEELTEKVRDVLALRAQRQPLAGEQATKNAARNG